MFRRFMITCAALSVLAAAGIAAKEKTVMVGGAAMYPSKDIIDNAMNSKDHTTLVAAVKAAGLVATLKGPGPFTVFAPTNEAFAKIPPALLNYLLSDPEGDLTATLLYHVVPGVNDVRYQYKARDLRTAQGQEVFADREGDYLWINNARVKGRVVQADNGIIYIIDSVLLPQYR